jgi:hypothetical protein
MRRDAGAVEFDGAQHLADPVAYRRDRRKDQVLQENGYLVLRFLAEDVGRELDVVLDAIPRALSHRQLMAPPEAPLRFVRRSQTWRAPGLPAGRQQAERVVAACDSKRTVEGNKAATMSAREAEEVSVGNLPSLCLPCALRA